MEAPLLVFLGLYTETEIEHAEPEKPAIFSFKTGLIAHKHSSPPALQAYQA